MIDLSVLNPQQRAAVENTEGALLVLAGAGSGKTRVLTYRVAKLLDQGVPPWRILAITFTNKAAREMAERVEHLTGEQGRDVWVSTFHSCCAKILRKDIEKLGYKRQFAIYDTDDSTTVVKGILKGMNLNEKDYPPRMVRAAISDAKNRMLSPEEWLKDVGPDPRNRRIYETYREYEKILKGNNALDFDDLMVKTLELLVQNPPVLEYYQDRFWYILIDEYQDTNAVQYEFVRLLAGKRRNLCVVGDDDQSIYGWRGADIRNILDFEKDFPDVRTIKLEQNYRSTGNILDAANQVIAHNRGRKDKALWTNEDAGSRITLYHALDERDEAAYVVGMTRRVISKNVLPGRIAVLYRTNAQSRVLEEAFVRAGIPYRVYGGLRFYERKEVKDLIAYMRVLVNPDDDVSLRRIINEPKRGIGESSINTLAEYAEESGMSMMNAALDAENAPLSSRARKQVEAFAEMMIDLTEILYEKKPSDFLQALIEKTGYVQALEDAKNEDGQARIENIRELQGAVSEYEQLHPEATLADFLENVALVSDTDSLNEGGGSVSLMTLHSAKGLEFDCVFIPGMEEGLFPSRRSIDDENRLEEERRLAYVGITRARRKLILSHARTRALYNMRSANELSRFVSEIPPRLLSDVNPGGEQRRVPPPSVSRGSDEGYFRGRSAAGYGSAANYVQSQARSVKPAALFKEGDRVIHRSFGRGTVVEVEGEGAQQRVKVNFERGGVRTFNASVAPIVKVEE